VVLIHVRRAFFSSCMLCRNVVVLREAIPVVGNWACDDKDGIDGASKFQSWL